MTTATVYATSLAAHMVAQEGTRLKGLGSAERHEAIEALTLSLTEHELRELARVALTVISFEVGTEALANLDRIGRHGAIFGTGGR
ncbi:hypothetical protein [Ferrimicrobium sp.]|uniref:hypothetical protein n=1 Tax=Ferrimicrobium sp. TaxID=2926050 RepID=UPI0026282A90|nr:hypothetical protein [Ferrimicrobium sp.]